MINWIRCKNSAGYKCSGCKYRIKNRQAMKFQYCPMCGQKATPIKMEQTIHPKQIVIEITGDFILQEDLNDW